MCPEQLGIGAYIGHRHRLATARVVGDRDHAKRNAIALLFEQPFSPRQVNVALERVNQRGLQALSNHQVQRINAKVFQIGAGGVKVAIVGHHLAFFTNRSEQHFFSGAALVRGHKKLHAGDVLDDFFKPVKAARAGVTLVAFHDGAPLAAGHGAGAGVGQPVNQHIFGAQLEHVQFGGFQQFNPFGASGHADGFDAFDTKWLNQGFGHGFFR